MTTPGSDAPSARERGPDVDRREPYASPRLLHYGDIAVLTQRAGGTMGMNDGGGGPNKTGF